MSQMCNVSIIDSENLMFPFTITVVEGDLYNKVECLKSCLRKSSLGFDS